MQKKRVRFFTFFSFVIFVSLVISTTASASSLILKKNMSGSEVTELQASLKEMGFLDTEPTGYYGEQTEAAVIKLQASYGLKEDGIAGQAVFSVISKAAAKKPGKAAVVSRGGADRGDIRSLIVATAKKYIGVPYVWGNANPEGFDSSGLLWYVFNKNGIKIPRVSFDIYKAGKPITKDELLPGDVVFFQGYAEGPSHGTIYAGDGNFIHSPSTGKTVSLSRLFDDKTYWLPRFYGARRLINENE